MPTGNGSDPMTTLGEKLDNLARNIEILSEATISLSISSERRGGPNLSYNMASSDLQNDIFRGKYYEENRRQASDAEKRAYREYVDELKRLLEEKIKLEEKLKNDAPRDKRALNKERKSLEAKISQKESERAHWQNERNNATNRADFEAADDAIINLTDEINKLTEQLEEIPKKINDVDKAIKKAERDVADTKGALGKSNTYENFAKNANEDRFTEAAQAAWTKMSTEQKGYYDTDFEKFKDAKWKQKEFNERYKERQETQRLIQNSGFENTAVGRIAQNALNRNQKYDNMRNTARKLTSEGGAEMLSKHLFGAGKGASFATQAFKGLGGIMGKFGRLLGGPVFNTIMIAIDALKAFGKALYDGVNEWAAINAEFVKYQTEQERIQYEKAKQFMIIDTQTEIEKITLAGDMAVKHTEMMSQNFLEGLSIQNEAFVKSMEIGTGAMNAGVAQTAYSAAEASIDQAAKARKLEIHQGQRQQTFELYQAQRQLQAEGKIAGLSAERQVAEVQSNVEMMKNAQNMYEYQLNLLNQTGLSGTGVVKGIGSFRTAENNTTTGVNGQGNVNAMTGETNRIEGVRDTLNTVPGAMEHGKVSSAIGALVGSDRHGFEAEDRALAENYWQQMTQGVDAMKTKTELYYNKATTQMEYYTQLAQIQVDTTTQAAESVIDAATAVEKNWLKTTQAMEEWLRKYDERMNDVGLNMGMWSKESLSAFKEGHLQTVKQIAQKYGKSEEQIAQYQTAMTETSGRNKLLGGGDLGATARLGITTGDDSLAAKYISEMELFNQSAESSANLMNEEMKSINKLGLNARKYMKDVTNNLKLAQKYNFKEGTKSLRDMVKWAQQTKFNMESLGGMLEKIQEGGIEGVLKTSAGFQVLGGMAAINSDPLGMLYDAWADPNAYAKRMQDMTKGFGTFNKKTGETEFNMPESMQIAQIAKLQGRSAEEVRGEIIRRNQTEAVKKSLTPEQRRGLNEEQIQYLSNAATYDTETGQWKVNMLNKNTGEISPMNLSEINGSNINDFAAVSENHDEKMETMLEELVSLVARERGEQWYQLADQAAMDYKETMDNLNERLRIQHDEYLKNSGDIHAEILKKQEEIKESTTDFLTQFASNVDNTTSDIAVETQKIREKTNDIGNALGQVAETVRAANELINQSIAEHVGRFGVNSANAISNAGKTVSKNGGTNVNASATADGESPQKQAAVSTRVAQNPRLNLHSMTASDTTGYSEKIAQNFKTPSNWKTISDGFISGDGESMAFNAKKIIPVNDGVGISNENDVGVVVGKPGGPFDTLFNSVFEKISAVYDTISDSKKFNAKERIEQYAIDKARNTLPQSFNREEWQNPSGYGRKTGENENKNVNVNINGRLMLDGNGQSVDVINLLRTNPDLVRKITEFIILQMSNNENGGKHDMFSNRYYR